MPEMTFEVRWPDGATQRCYSPSLVMHDHLRTGGEYTVAEFVERSARALDAASERVRAKYGFACTSAAETKERITHAANAFPDTAQVKVLSMNPELETS